MRGHLRKLIARVSVQAVSALLIAACATTQLKEQWRDANYRAASPQHVLVIGVIGNDQRRRLFEDRFVARLREAGAQASASYPQLNVNGPENLDAVRALVERSGATLVLSVRLMDIAKETRVSGGYYSGGYYGPSSFYGHYPHVWAGTYYPPSAYTHRTYTTETRVFDMKGDKMVWAATMLTEEPRDVESATSQYVDLVMKQLQYNQIIASR